MHMNAFIFNKFPWTQRISSNVNASQLRFLPNRKRYSSSLLQSLVCNSTLPTFTGFKSIRHSCNFKSYATLNMDCPGNIFEGTKDRFNGITVESKQEFTKCEKFSDKLAESLGYWNANNHRTVWFKVETAHSEWIPDLTKSGFEFHHANAGYVVLYRWLPKNEPMNLPVYAHTMVGVGGVVVNESNEILVVSDRHGLIANSWKLPGGYAEPNENLVDAVIREVQEETGIKSKFSTVLSMRHSHSGNFGCSDIYVVIALKPLTSHLIPCEREIAKVQWMPIDEYLHHPNVHETNRLFVRTFLDYSKRGICFIYKKAVHQILKKEYCVYYLEPMGNEKCDEELDRK